MLMSEFKEIYENKYERKMPVYKFLFHFPTSSIKDLEQAIAYFKLKVSEGFIIDKEIQ